MFGVVVLVCGGGASAAPVVPGGLVWRTARAVSIMRAVRSVIARVSRGAMAVHSPSPKCIVSVGYNARRVNGALQALERPRAGVGL